MIENNFFSSQVTNSEWKKIKILVIVPCYVIDEKVTLASDS
jgi:hypothetical protein